MSLIRYSILLCCFLAVCNCEDNKTSTNQAQTNENTKNTLKKPKTPKAKQPEIKLTEGNAMDFFQKYDKEHPETVVRIYTRFGNIDLELFRETNFHRANFIYLTKQQYFDGTQFHRVVNNFIIQGGNTDNPAIGKKRTKIGKYLIPKDTRHGFKHHRGVASVPSSDIDNPHKLASPYEFFIVQAPKGAYHLDGNYTAFAQVINGMEVVDEIAAQPADEFEWPVSTILIDSVRVVR